MLVATCILVLCAVSVRLWPGLINPLSEEDRRRMDRKKAGRYAFWGLMTTAVVLLALYICDIRHELVPVVVLPIGALITATLIQLSIPQRR